LRVSGIATLTVCAYVLLSGLDTIYSETRGVRRRRRRKKERKKRARSDDDVATTESSAHSQVGSSLSIAGADEEENLRRSGKQQRSGSNNCRTQKEYWKERLDYKVIEFNISQGCSCTFKCVAKMKAGRVFECRGRNSKKSSAELSSHCLHKLDHFFKRDLGTMSYSTENGRPCCRKGFQIEQGFTPAYVHRKVKKILKGQTQDTDRGGARTLSF